MKKILTYLVLCWTLLCNAAPLHLNDPALLRQGQGIANAFSNAYASASSQRLSMSDANFGSFTYAKWSISAWVKRDSTGSTHCIISQWNATGSASFQLMFTSTDALQFDTSSDGTTTFNGSLKTNATYTDTASWHNIIVHFDSANGTSSERMKIFYDGTQVTSLATATYPTAAAFDSTASVAIGMRNSALYFNGKIDELLFCDNYLIQPSDVMTGLPGVPKNLASVTGRKSWTRSDNGITVDEILATAWTNTNGVTQSSEHP